MNVSGYMVYLWYRKRMIRGLQRSRRMKQKKPYWVPRPDGCSTYGMRWKPTFFQGEVLHKTRMKTLRIYYDNRPSRTTCP